MASGCRIVSAVLVTCVLTLDSFARSEYEIDYDSAELRQIELSVGKVRGYSMPLVNKSCCRFEAFVGLPYAEPPLGELRWKPPRDVTRLPTGNTTYNATYFRPCCPQNLQNLQSLSLGPSYNNTSEDCLYLNVFTVTNTTTTNTTLRPVMVWIHGGAFRYGSAEEYDARILAQQGVVVVTVNYRLGVIGFLSTDDELASGNYGLLDMVSALRWVQANIDKFGGDSRSVTVFGQSAGGAAVSLLMFSNLTKGLMHRVIAQSGDALARWAIYRPPDKNINCTIQLAQKVGCPTDPVQSMLDCLRLKDALLLVNTQLSGCASSFNANWAPRIDNVFITKAPEELLAEGNFHFVDFLTGTVPDEVSDEYTTEPDIEIGFSRENKEQRMYDWSRRYTYWADLMYASVRHEYDSAGNNYSQHRDLYIEMRSDFEYIAPHNAHVTGHSSAVANSFLYSFEYRSVNIPTPTWMGVPHFEECYYTFGVPYWPDNAACPWGCLNTVWHARQQWLPEDFSMSRQMMDAWTNFAKYGDPSGGSWPRFNSTDQPYMAVRQQWSALNYYKYRRVDFWNRFVPVVLNTSFDLWCSTNNASAVSIHPPTP